MSKPLDVLVPVAVFVVITCAMGYAAGIEIQPSWSALFPARHSQFASSPALAEGAPNPKAESWCARGTLVGGFCVLK
jgi:hypothetical protein